MARNLSSLTLLVGANIKGFQTQMRKMSRDMKRVGGQMKNMGKSMSMYVTAPIIALGAASVKTFANFEQEMAKVNAVSGATNAEFQKLTKNAKLLGESTRFTASQVAALQLNYSKLGFKPDEILKVTDATLNLALATGSDLAESATVAASTLRGFELSASEMQRVTDVMALSFSSSALDLEKFKTAMATVAPVAKNAGMSLEQTTAMLGVLVNRGVDASTAGTALRNIFLTLAKDGITLEQAFSRINNASNKNKESLALFGKRGATVATILAENTEEAGNLAVKFDNASGSAASMAGVMDNTLQGSFLKVQSALEGLAIEFGTTLKPVVDDGIKLIQELIGKFRSLTPQGKKITVMLGLIAAAMGPVLVVLGAFISVVLPGIITGFAALGTAFTSLSTMIMANPIGALITVIGLATAALYLFTSNSEDAAEAQWELGDAVRDVNAALGEEIWTKLVAGMKMGADGVLKTAGSFDNLKDNISELTDGELKSLKQFLENELSVAQSEAARTQNNLYKEILIQRIKDFKEGLKLVANEYGKVATQAKEAITAIREFNSVTPIGPRKTNEVVPSQNTNKPEMADGGDRSISDDVKKVLDLKPVTKKAIQFLFPDVDKTNIEEMKVALAELKEISEAVGVAIADSFASFANGMLRSLKLADHGFQGFIKALIKGAIKMISILMAQSIANAIMGGTSSGAATGPGAIIATPVFIATLVGTVLGAFAAIPKFADGGIVPGGFPNDTYPALLTSGEMVVPSPIPLSGGMGAGGNMNFTGTSRISGKDLLLVFDKAKADRNRTTGY
ncbi:MAG: phage tail tape measure protein [Methylococcales bacterium]|nr:phage tail tape measure protein [Methylococcales bacterium]